VNLAQIRSVVPDIFCDKQKKDKKSITYMYSAKTELYVRAVIKVVGATSSEGL